MPIRKVMWAVQLFQLTRHRFSLISGILQLHSGILVLQICTYIVHVSAQAPLGKSVAVGCTTASERQEAADKWLCAITRTRTAPSRKLARTERAVARVGRCAVAAPHEPPRSPHRTSHPALCTARPSETAARSAHRTRETARSLAEDRAHLKKAESSSSSAETG